MCTSSGTSSIDGRTAVVTLTHDPKLDDPALAAALAARPFYIGALGSTRTSLSATSPASRTKILLWIISTTYCR